MDQWIFLSLVHTGSFFMKSPVFKLNHSNRTKSKILIADFRIANKYFAQNILGKNAHMNRLCVYTQELSTSKNIIKKLTCVFQTPALIRTS